VHVRMTTITGATNIDAGVDFLRDQVVPQVAQQNGFQGLIASSDRAAGVVGVITIWDSEEALLASESAVAKNREEAAGVLGGGQPDVRIFEQPVGETGDTPLAAGCPLRIRPFRVDPGQIDKILSVFTAEVLPQIKAVPGFRGVRFMIDRATGEGSVGTAWADEDALRAADAGFEQRSQQVRDLGVRFGDSTRREILLVAL